jgi:hypothetical protein
MENFTAADDRGWKTIQRTIDLSDYYVLILAGMYGSPDPTTGISWTEREYRYAREKKMRVLAFIREDTHVTADKLEKDVDARSKLDALKRDVRDSHLCEFWKTEDDLKARVMQALQSQIAEDEDSGEPRPGWYRGDELGTSPAVLEEFARLSAANAQLQRQVEALEGNSKEQLELVESDGVALADKNFESPRVSVLSPPQLPFSVLDSSFLLPGKPTREGAIRHARREALTVWVKLRIQNTGTRPARNVVADFMATPVDKVYVHTFGDRSAFPVPAKGRPFYLDPSEHVYVESHRAEGGEAAVRQRIKQVAAGGYEPLITMGFEAPSDYDRDEDIPVAVSYTLRSEDGVTCSGSCVLTIQLRGAVELTIEEALGRA